MNILSNLMVVMSIYSEYANKTLNFIGKYIEWLTKITGGVGIAIILFTLTIKLITLPLDGYSRASMRKNSLKMEKMRPQLEKLQKQYANDKDMYSRKIMELYKKEGYSMLGMCLPTLVTLVFFFVVLSQFQSYSKFVALKNYKDMIESYNEAVIECCDKVEEDGKIVYYANKQKAKDIVGNVNEDDIEGDITLYAQKKAAERYRASDVKFLWVKNIWLADNATVHPVQQYSKFVSTVSTSQNITEEIYNKITAGLGKEKSQANGYFIFVVISAGVSFLSQWILGKSQKSQMELQSNDGRGAQTQKMMLIIMPLMIGVFALSYTAAFCVYMTTNSILTIISTLFINKIVDISFAKKEREEEMKRLNGRFIRINSSTNNQYNKKSK